MSSVQDNFRGVRDDAKERLSSDLDQLKSSFSQLRSDVTHILGNALGAGKSSVRTGTEGVRTQANAAVDRVRGGYDDLRAKGTDQVEHLGNLITERPLASALIAFGVGFVIAKVLVRK